MPFETSALLEPVIRLAAQASERIMAIYATGFSVVKKADASPLTAADTASHETISQGLQSLTPDIPVLSEESASVPFEQRVHWPRFWLVDPLDGTKEFINRNGEFTVNIALIERGKPILGVVHIPATGVCYYAARELGAFRQERGAADHRIAAQASPDEAVLRVVGSRSHGGEKVAAFAQALGSPSIHRRGQFPEVLPGG